MKMKISQKTKIKKQQTKKKSVAKPKKEHVLIIAQELKFARLLAGNEKKSRDRALKTLKKWLLNCFDRGYEFKEDDFARIWKGLFYAVWMSDKPLVQEELCENIASILDLFPEQQYKHALSFARVGFETMAREWYGLDYHRMDKCLMLVRRFLRGSLRVVARLGWTDVACRKYAKMLSGEKGILATKTPVYARNATSMILHVIDCFLEELAKVSEGKISDSAVATLLSPFCRLVCGGSSAAVCVGARRLLTALLRQSAPGLRYRQRARAWQRMGCPGSGPDCLELVEDSDENQSDEDEEESEEEGRDKPLDPRAGRVDVRLRALPVPGAQLAAAIRALLPAAAPGDIQRARLCMQRFEQVAQDTYPLVLSAPPAPPAAPRPARAAAQLHALEKRLAATSDELALRGLSRKHRKRLLAKSRAGLSIVEDAAALAAATHNAAGDWVVEDAEPPKKKKKDTSNKENVNKKRQEKKRKPQQNGDAAKKQKAHQKPTTDQQKLATDNQKLTTDKQKTTENQKQKKQKVKPEMKLEVKTKKTTENKAEKEKTSQNRGKKSENIRKDIGKKLKTSPSIVVKKAKSFAVKPRNTEEVDKNMFQTPKKVKFVLKNNSMQETIDYYKSVRQSPNIPFDSTRVPSKTNLKVSTPSPINPFFKKKWKMAK